MTKSAGSYKDFLALVRSDGLARASKFEVQITPPVGNNPNFQPTSIIPLKEVSLLAEATELPAMNIKTERLDIYGPTYPRPVGIDFGDTITFSFYLDRGLKIRTMFERWLHMVVDTDTYNVNYQNTYIANEIAIKKLDGKDDVVKAYVFKECMPIAIGKTQLGSGMDEFSKMDVTFAYRKWEVEMYSSEAKWKSRSIFSPLEAVYDLASSTFAAGTNLISGAIGAVDNELNDIINGPV